MTEPTYYTATVLPPSDPSNPPQKPHSPFLTLGLMGVHFAWASQFALSHTVLEPLGASPLVFGLTWFIATLLSLVVQPFVTGITPAQQGRINPLLLVGLVAIASFFYLPTANPLLTACVLFSVSVISLYSLQAIYRKALACEGLPTQVALATTTDAAPFIYALPAVTALGLPPLLQSATIAISLTQQYYMVSIVLAGCLCLGVLLTKRTSPPVTNSPPLAQPLVRVVASMIEGFSAIARANKNVGKLCLLQFSLWLGVFCATLYFTPYVVHHIYQLPNTATDGYRQEESLYRLAETIDDHTISDTDYQTLSTTINTLNAQKKQWLSPSVSEVTALNNQLDQTLSQYLGDTLPIQTALNTIVPLAKTKQFVSGISEPERLIELKLAILTFPLYEKVLDTQTDANLPETDQTLAAFSNLPLLETLDKQGFFADTLTRAHHTALLGLAMLNAMVLLLNLPFAWLAKRIGQKGLLAIALPIMAISLGVAPWVDSELGVLCLMVGAGIGFTAILSAPLALLTHHITKGDEPAMHRVFRLLGYLPQALAAVVVGGLVQQLPMPMAYGSTHHWEAAFIVASAAIGFSLLLLPFIKEPSATTTH